MRGGFSALQRNNDEAALTLLKAGASREIRIGARSIEDMLKSAWRSPAVRVFLATAP